MRRRKKLVEQVEPRYAFEARPPSAEDIARWHTDGEDAGVSFDVYACVDTTSGAEVIADVEAWKAENDIPADTLSYIVLERIAAALGSEQ